MNELVELTIVYEDAGDGWITASVAELPGILSQGRDLAEARTMIRSALQDWLRFYVADQGGAAPARLPRGASSERLHLTIAA
jgi:predicted RNase H-like HicB family nuclease